MYLFRDECTHTHTHTRNVQYTTVVNQKRIRDALLYFWTQRLECSRVPVSFFSFPFEAFYLQRALEKDQEHEVEE